jgi:iron(III) transport system permease protein
LTYTIPSYILAVAWIELLGRNGFVNRILCGRLRLIDMSINIYSLQGIILIMDMHLFPLVFAAVSAALRINDGTLEMAARLAGAGWVNLEFWLRLSQQLFYL